MTEQATVEDLKTELEKVRRDREDLVKDAMSLGSLRAVYSFILDTVKERDGFRDALEKNLGLCLEVEHDGTPGCDEDDLCGACAAKAALEGKAVKVRLTRKALGDRIKELSAGRDEYFRLATMLLNRIGKKVTLSPHEQLVMEGAKPGLKVTHHQHDQGIDLELVTI